MIQEDQFHKITISENGLCNLCQNQKKYQFLGWDRLKNIFEKKIESIRGKKDYDGLLMLSGGKDSAYLAYVLIKIYRLKLLGFTIDNGFEYQETFHNAKDIAQKTGIPYIYYKPDTGLMKEFYQFIITEESLKRKDFGQICLFCGRYFKNLAADFARRSNIPVVFSGHNADQVFGMGEALDLEIDPARKMYQQSIRRGISDMLKKAIETCEAKSKKHLISFFPKQLNPHSVESLYFFYHFPYRPMEMMEMVSKELNWKPVEHFSSTYIASGCKLFKLLAYLAFLNKTCSYVDLEFSSQIRSNVLDRELVKKFHANIVKDDGEIVSLLEELGISRKPQDLL